ncbi:MAG: 4-hydroxy-3-methylbut-2-enyl diphosphate reductase [Fusobacterium sp. JB019]|nr:4-hydroxy-3-methylbut-2-enyl diphosphate reductase [Fusobacterium sp. JB019]
MKIIRAEKMGFCFGVAGAINLCESVIKTEKDYNKAYILGMLVHNKNVVEDMEKKGFITVSEEDLISGKIKFEKKDLIIIRAHGTTEEIYDILKRSEIKIIDATCIFVKKIRETLIEAGKNGKEILFIGDKNHPEVKGIVSFGRNVKVLANYDEFLDFEVEKNKKYCLLTQTTLNKEIFFQIKKNIENNYENIEIFSKICGATYERQIAVEKLAKEVDVVLIVGDLASSNTKKLYNLSKSINNKSYLIQNKSELNRKWLQNIKNIGITAGASTPEKVILEIEKDIRGNFDDKHGL